MIRKNTSSICDRPKKYLSDKHRDDLRESGLTDETIERCGFHTESDPEIVRQHLNWKSGNLLETMGPFLAIPYSDRQARRTGFIRYKPDAPRPCPVGDDKWKPVKYESPRRVPARPYFPVAALSAINTSGAGLSR